MVYTIKRNCVTSSQWKSKKKYYFNAFFEENQSNIKETWNGIRKLINVSKKSTTNISKIIKNGKEITSPKEMADTINDFYVNIGKTVEQKNPMGDKSFSYYLRNIVIFSILCLNPCTDEKVRKCISDLMT